jgi:hypothetical protein
MTDAIGNNALAAVEQRRAFTQPNRQAIEINRPMKKHPK